MFIKYLYDVSFNYLSNEEILSEKEKDATNSSLIPKLYKPVT